MYVYLIIRIYLYTLLSLSFEKYKDHLATDGSTTANHNLSGWKLLIFVEFVGI